jgi:outer membrane receptor for ferrienterochelin and colicin
MKKHYLYVTTALAFTSGIAGAQRALPTDSIDNDYQDIEEVVVTANNGTRKMRYSAGNTELITSAELKRAACCNLGESFTTNPSVDVSYSDAATGSKQIKLLGLSGNYVQMLTENIPNFRGAASPYGLGYMAGPWMHSIQVSKGASSVKNGYESITGQINIEMLKPQNDQSLALNAYADHMGRVEGNATGNIHLGDKWSTGLLLHAENMFSAHDQNGDGFIDKPKVRQFSGMNRWAYMGDSYIFQAGVKYLNEKRESGQDEKHASHSEDDHLYTVGVRTNRWEGFMKNAYIFDQENNANVALMLSGSLHDQGSNYGHKQYDVMQKNFYASLMFERNFGELHSLSTGLSYNYDNYHQDYRLTHDRSLGTTTLNEHEGVAGAYAQYTFDWEKKVIAMAGLRYDYSSEFGSMVTPRVHVRWNPFRALSIHGSAGKGYRNAHCLAEYNYLLASSRHIVVPTDKKQESAWNFGGGISSTFDLFGKPMTISGEYYYTEFHNQAVVNLDSDPHAALLTYNSGKSFSHTAQVEVTYQPIRELSMTLAYRYTDVKENYGAGLTRKPLTSKSKGLFTVSYAPMMGLWQFDATLAINGGGRMPTPYSVDGEQSWDQHYKAYPTLNLQVTRSFRHWSVYIGGENLTNFKQKHPIIDASNPWGDRFDATMVYGPIEGAVAYIGVRYTFTKY